MNSDKQTALVLEAIWRLYAGRLDRFRPAEKTPTEIENFLATKPSVADRQAALLAILQSAIAEGSVGRTDASGRGQLGLNEES